jgi:hypothetical protein
MIGLEFASTLIDHLLWPLVVVAAIVLFRKPLSALIGRVTHYEGLGQKLDFGSALAEAEGSVGRAVESATIPRRRREGEPSLIGQAAQSNPPYVIIQAWEQISGALDLLKDVAQPGRKGSWNGRIPPELIENGIVAADFAQAIQELRELRNRVAHGQSDPTPGEAAAYTATTARLTDFALDLAASLEISQAGAQQSFPSAPASRASPPPGTS